MPTIKKPVKYGIIAIASLIMFLIFDPFFTVGIGQVAVIFNTLNGNTRTVDQGLHVRIPIIDHVSKFDVRTAKVDYQPVGASKDLQEVKFEIALNYHLDYTKVNELYNRVGRDYLSKVVEPSILEVVKAAASRYPVEQLIVQREQLKQDMEKALQTKLTEYFIIVEAVSIIDIDFTDQFNKVVEEKQIEEQKIKTAEYRRKQAEEEKKTAILQAEAEARKQQLLQSSATKEIISLEWIRKWDGKLPTVISSDKGGLLMQMPSGQ